MKRATRIWLEPFIHTLRHHPWPGVVVHTERQLSKFVQEVLELAQIPYQKECRLLYPASHPQGNEIWVNDRLYSCLVADYRVYSSAVELKSNGHNPASVMKQGLKQINDYLGCPGITDSILIYCNHLHRKLEVYVAYKQNALPFFYGTISITSPSAFPPSSPKKARYWGEKKGKALTTQN